MPGEPPHGVGRLITLFERDDPAAPADRAEAAAELEPLPIAPVVALTGAPGVGKSSLIGALLPHLAVLRTVAVVAVDPSSVQSGGAFLGDRMRIRPVSEGVFVRSQAAGPEPGGVAPRTYPVVRLLRRLFGLVIVETGGVGQSEVAARRLADEVLLLVQPLAGDALQHLKAGVMEACDRVVLTKADVGEHAVLALAELRAVIGLARPAVDVPISVVSARSGEGVSELAAAVACVAAGAEAAADAWYVRSIVRGAFGRVGEERVLRAGVPATGSLDERTARALVLASG